MIRRNVLITGGAGFIGSHLSDSLIGQGHRVRVVDNLCRRVHGKIDGRPPYLSPAAEFVKGDIRDRKAVKKALAGIDVVFHLAARVGISQSMYEMEEYTDVNTCGTAILMEEIVYNQLSLHRFVVASCMSIYGEGLYRDGDEYVANAAREVSHLKAGKWEPQRNGRALQPCPTPETKAPELSSIYALSKYEQERLCLIAGRTYQIPVTALRLFNVYGTRHSFSNPHADLPTLVSTRYLNENSPVIYEDGGQQRDFVSVYDVVQACCLAMEKDNAVGEVFNIGSGIPCRIKTLAKMISEELNKTYMPPRVSGKYRVSDIRHCYADISKAKKILGYAPQVKLKDGLSELTSWLEKQAAGALGEEDILELHKRNFTF